MEKDRLRARVGRLLHLDPVPGDRDGLAEYLCSLGTIPAIRRRHALLRARLPGEGLSAHIERALADGSALTGPWEDRVADPDTLLGAHELWTWALAQSIAAAFAHDARHVRGLPVPDAATIQQIAGRAALALPADVRRAFQARWWSWLMRPELPTTAHVRHLSPCIAGEPALLDALTTLRTAAWGEVLGWLDDSAPALGAALRADPGRSALGALVIVAAGRSWEAVDAEALGQDPGPSGGGSAYGASNSLALRCGVRLRTDVPLTPPLPWLSAVEALVPTEREPHRGRSLSDAVGDAPQDGILQDLSRQLPRFERLRILLLDTLGLPPGPPVRPRPTAPPAAWSVLLEAAEGQPAEALDALRLFADAWSAAEAQLHPALEGPRAELLRGDPGRGDEVLKAWIRLGCAWLVARLALELAAVARTPSARRSFDEHLGVWLRQGRSTAAKAGRYRLADGAPRGFELDLLASGADLAFARHLARGSGGAAVAWVGNESVEIRGGIVGLARAGAQEDVRSLTAVLKPVFAPDATQTAWANQVNAAGGRAWCSSELDEALHGSGPLGPEAPPVRSTAARHREALPAEPWRSVESRAQPPGSGRDQHPERSLDWLRARLNGAVTPGGDPHV